MGKKKKKSKVKKSVAKVKKVFKDHPELQRVENHPNRDGVKLSENLIKAIAGSVRVNKTLTKREKKQRKEWQDTYYQSLFSKFKQLVEEHNKIWEFELDKIESKIKTKKRELNGLKKEIKRLKAIIKEG